ncbi:uncharacterized protein TRUGW13939_02110 [Talaromyces rugulosus]|uniref:Uncharacterized protein n=1 Tax=Talaromyces rugulosus TaxID=121627 RepID=A0A7H8QM64_TALRU|nr:uncharacterized protein TRUGW13939_02110 [Talaromyces rugulosus]QKX55019.1 hypothetical protein TRUGW13939_02110 [Talaromyces rugulosus]
MGIRTPNQNAEYNWLAHAVGSERSDAVANHLKAGSTAIEAQQSTQVYRTLHPMMSSSSNLVTTMVPSPYGSDSLQSLPAAMSTSSSPMLHTTQSQSLSDMGGHYSPPSPWPRTGPVYQVSSLVEDVYAAPYDSSSSSAYVHPGSSAISYTGGGYRSSSPPSREWEASGSMLQSAVLYSEPDIAPSSSTRQNSSPSSDIPSLFPVVNMLSTGDAPIIGGASSSTNDSELIGSGLPFMASEYFAYPMHRPNSTTTSFRPRSSSTSITSVVPPLKSDLSTSPFYVNDPHGSSSAVTAAAAVPMNPVYDTVEQSNPSEGSLVMSSMSAGLKESPSESGSYEYVNGEQHYGNVEADNSSTSAILGNQQEYDHFKKSNDDPAVTYNDAFEGFLQ